MSPLHRMLAPLLFLAALWAVPATAADALDIKQASKLIEAGRSEKLAQLLKSHRADELGEREHTLLMMAAIDRTQAEALDVLLEWGLPADHDLLLSVHGKPTPVAPLNLAVLSGKLPLVQQLVRHGADVNRASDDNLPLHMALATSQYEIARYLLRQGADAGAAEGPQRRTPLMVLALGAFPPAEKKVQRMALIRQIGAVHSRLDARNAKGETPLQLALQVNDLEGARVLLALGADPDVPNAAGVSALSQASRANRVEAVDLLLQYGGRP